MKIPKIESVGGDCQHDKRKQQKNWNIMHHNIASNNDTMKQVEKLQV